MIWNATSQKWEMTENPTQQQVDLSATHLQAVDLNASNALENSDAAKKVAAAAQSTADSKVTATEALTAAKEGIFVVKPLNGTHEKFRSIEFFEESPGAWSVWINFGDPSLSPTSATRGWLNYVAKPDFDELFDRVGEIERRLGIN